jgi:hypothetical protein
MNEISIHLLSLRKKITAKKLMDFLHQADIKEKYGIEHDISHKTACQYLQALGYHYHSTPKGQYVDGQKGRTLLLIARKCFIQNGRNSRIGWQYGTRISQSTC